MLNFFPELVRVDATWRCNLACKHCQTVMFRGPNHPQDLTTEEMCSIFEQLSEMGTTMIGFLGGEPLLRKDLPDLLLKAKELAIQTNITTNGLLLREDLATFLATESKTSIAVSLDGPSEESHEYIRGAGSFAKALRGIKAALTVRPSDGSVKVGISAVLHRRNLDQAELFLDLAQSLEVDYIVIAAVHPVGNAIRHWNDISLRPSELVHVGELLARRIYSDSTLPAVRVNFFTPAFQEYLRKYKGIPAARDPRIDRAGLYECYIQCDGRVFPSQMCSEMVPTVLDGAALYGINFRGNSIREATLAEIWNGPDFEKYRSFVLKKRYLESYTPCSTCRFSKSFCQPLASNAFMGETVPQAICEEIDSVLSSASLDDRASVFS